MLLAKHNTIRPPQVVIQFLVLAEYKIECGQKGWPLYIPLAV